MMKRSFEKEVIPVCEELGIGFVSFSPLVSGFLLGKYSKNTEYKGDDVRRVIENLGAADIELTDEEYNNIEIELSKITIYRNRTDEDC